MSEEEEKGAPVKTWQVIAAVFVIAVVIGVLLVLNEDNSTIERNGFVFHKVECPGDGDCWQALVITNVGEHYVTFYHSPEETEEVLVDPRAVQKIMNMTRFENTSIIIAVNDGAPAEVGIAGAMISRVTGERLFRVQTTGAVYGQEVTCAAVTPLRAVIHITQDPLTGVKYSNGCILVHARSEDELRLVADAFVQRLLGML